MADVDHKALKFRLDDSIRWFEAVLMDPLTTDFDMSLAVAISSATDRASGRCIRSQRWLAKQTSATERAVRNGTQRMESRGLLLIDRSETQKEGIAFGGAGRGKANVYEPIAPPRPWKKRGTDVPHSDKEKGNGNPGKGERELQKRGTAVPPSPYTIQSSFQVGDLLEGEPQSALPAASGGWPAVKRRLVERFGHDFCRSWFDKLDYRSTSEGDVTIVAPTRFILSYVQSNYAIAIEQAWNAEHPAAPPVRLRLMMRQDLRAAE